MAYAVCAQAQELILSSLKPHTCRYSSCGANSVPHHAGCYELDSDVFIQATLLVKDSIEDTFPPD